MYKDNTNTANQLQHYKGCFICGSHPIKSEVRLICILFLLPRLKIMCIIHGIYCYIQYVNKVYVVGLWAGNVFPRRRFQMKPLVSDHGMHHGTCVTNVPCCMSGSVTCGDGENIPGITGPCVPASLRIWQEAHRMMHFCRSTLPSI